SGGGVLSAVMGGATALGALRAYGGASGGGRTESAGEHADYLGQQLGERPGDRHDDGKAAQPPVVPDRTASGQQGNEGEQGPSAAVAPSGSGQPDGSVASTPRQAKGDESSGGGWAPPGGGHDEPVGPTAIRAADKEMHRGQDTIRWLGNPTGSGDDNSGAPSGAVGDGGGGNG
ncbi:hypothetical protein AB0L25_40940, partial [Spirillospora sp. NPDC052242]